jgi:hypothetical protein
VLAWIILITFADTLDLMLYFASTVCVLHLGDSSFTINLSNILAFCVLFLTIMNDDIRSMHRGAQHGLRMRHSGSWLRVRALGRVLSFGFA